MIFRPLCGRVPIFGICLALSLSSCATRHPSTLSNRFAPAPVPATAQADDDHDDDDSEEEEGNPAAEWARSRRVAPGENEIHWEAFDLASAQLARMPRTSAASAGRLAPRAASAAGTDAWASLGPGVVGGRTRGLAVNPKDPNILYAANVTGGVWKTTDSGQHWKPLTDGLPNLSFGAITLDPSDPNTIYAGGGEQYSSYAGLGIYKSADAGATWNLLPGTARSTNFAYVNRIVVSPASSQRLYAATQAGIVASRDGGATWARTVTANYYGCGDLAIRTDKTTDYLYAICSGATATDTFSVYRNTDAGGAGTWTSVYTANNMGRSVLAVAPSNQSTIYVAAAGLGNNPASPRDGVGLAGVFRSTADGDPGTWTTQVSPADANPFNFILFKAAGSSTTAYCASGATVPNDGGTWGKMIAVDPLDSNRVWVGGVDLYRSDNGGVSWGVASEWNLANAQAAHADRHAILFHPAYNGGTNQTAWQLTDGGIFRTDNARASVSTGTRAGCQTEFQAGSAVTWTQLNTDYTVTQFFKGAAYPGGQSYFGGSQDTGTNRGSDGSPNSWTRLGGGDGGSVAVDPIDPNRFLITSQTLALQRSLDGGATITNAVTGITENAAAFPFEAYVAIDPTQPNNVYIGGSTNLWRSSDFAGTWTASAPVGTNGAVSAISVSPFDSAKVIFGTASGFLYRSSNALQANATWTSVRPRTGNVSSIAFDPVTPDVVYAVYSSTKGTNTSLAHVYRSTDGGLTWTPRDGTGTAAVPDIPTWRLLVNPRNPQLLYLGSDLGVLISQDGGATWSHDDSLPNVIVEDLAFDTGTNNYLFAFTHGRGVFRTTLPGAPAGCTYSASPTSIDAPIEGGVFPVAVSTSAACAWSAVSGTTPSRFIIQSPAQGIGSGTAYVTVPPNIDGAAAADVVSVAAQAINVSQPASTFRSVVGDLRVSAATIAIPSVTRISARSLTSSADDPVHSCTNSPDFATGWWQVTPAVSGFLKVQARGDRLDVFGNSGLAITAYSKTDPTTELTCATIPRDTTSRAIGSASIPVKAGETYVIELAALTSDGGNANYNLVVSMGNSPTSVVVTPKDVTLAPGDAAVQLSATVSGPDNKSVRWSLSPNVGSISQSGLYTPPATAATPLVVRASAASFFDPSKSAVATINLAQPASITALPSGLVNAASYAGGGVSPGEIAVLFGAGFGPSALSGLTLGPDGKITTASGNTSVTFDQVPAPMIYSVSGQLSLIVPYSVAGKTSTVMRVIYNGQTSPAATVRVLPSVPGLFTNNASGAGQAAALNQDLSRNTPDNPAARGSIVVLYGTGEGQTSPPGVDGLINATAFPAPATTPISIKIGGLDSNIGYFGAAPGLVSGLFQANVTIPTTVTPGAVPVVVTVGTASSPTGVTISVK